MAIRGEVFSSKAHTGKRVYFFNVKENRNGDLFLNMVESKKQLNEGDAFERHSMIVFEEDLDTFLASLQDAVDYIREVQGRSVAPRPLTSGSYRPSKDYDLTRKLADAVEEPVHREWEDGPDEN